MELPFIYDRSNLASFIKRDREQSHGFSPDEKSVAGGQTTSTMEPTVFRVETSQLFYFFPSPFFSSVGKREFA